MGDFRAAQREAVRLAEIRWREEAAQEEAAERMALADKIVMALADKIVMALADKIVMAVVDRIAADIIRPGPKPEERECYVMAQELRDHTKHLSELVAAILKVDEDEDG